MQGIRYGLTEARLREIFLCCKRQTWLGTTKSKSSKQAVTTEPGMRRCEHTARMMCQCEMTVKPS